SKILGSQTCELMGAVEDVRGPGFVFEIPLHGLAEAGDVVLRGGPAELGFDLGGVDGVAQVVAGAVGDEGDLVGVGFAVGARPEFDEQGAAQADEVDVIALVVAADVVGLADPTAGDHGVQRLGVVADVEPVADVFTAAVNGDGFAAQGLEDDDGDELFGELIRAVIVGAVGHEHGEAVGVVPGAGEVIAGGLAGGVGRVRIVGGGLGERGGVGGQAAVNLVGGNVQEAEAGAGLAGEGIEVGAGGLEEGVGAGDVGLDERAGAVDGAINVAFGGEVHDPVGAEFGEVFGERGGVGDVGL